MVCFTKRLNKNVEKEQSMTIKMFANREGVHEDTVLRWLKKGSLKGAKKTYSGRLIRWDIPEDARKVGVESRADERDCIGWKP